MRHNDAMRSDLSARIRTKQSKKLRSASFAFEEQQRCSADVFQKDIFVALTKRLALSVHHNQAASYLIRRSLVHNQKNTTMPSHELVYFDGKGRAEAIRICFSAAGVDFVDKRIKFQEWMDLKPQTPLGSLPVLKVDGVEHCQSTALLRYAGSLAGWYPASDPLQALTVDQAVESLNELMAKAPQVKGDEDAKKKAREEYQATVMKQYSTFLEAAIQRNGGAGFTKDFSIADLLMQGMVESIESGMWDYIDKSFFDAYPGIKATAELASKNEKVVGYYKSKE